MKSILILLAIAITTVNSFTLPINRRYAFAATTITRLYSDNSNENNSGSKTKFGEQATSVEERFLTDFRTADGELVDPYKLLNIKRSATKTEIKESYRRLSRKLHPDAVQSNILPGRCQNLDDVREEWERVKFSYEILIDPKSRKSYDRNSKVAEVLEDPTKAVGRAVVGGTMSGLGMVLGGAFKLGEMATKKVYETAMNEKKETPTTPTPSEESMKTSQTKEESSNTGPISMEAMRQMNMEARKNANSLSASNDSTTSERDYASIDTKSDNANSSTTVDISTPVSNKEEKEMKKTVDLKPKAATKMNIITSNPSASASSSSKQKKKKKNKRRKGGGRGFG